MTKALSEFIVDYPPSPRPSLVDSAIMSIQGIRTGELQVSPAQAAILLQQWEEWGEQIATFANLSPRIGVDYLKILPDQPMIDCKPGSNRYSIFDDYKTIEYQNDILRTFAPDINLPNQVSAADFLDGQELALPFVFKDASINQGVNKFLVETAEQRRTLRIFLAEYRRQHPLDDLVLEAFVETPTDKSTSYRFTMTPTGSILAASLLSAGEGHKVDLSTVSRPFAALADPDSRHYLASRSITSNTKIGRLVAGLDFEERELELAPLGPKQQNLLEAHGMDGNTRRAPEQVEAAARKIARAIGPSIGLLLGLDILQEDQSGTPFFLEANSVPSNQNINETIHPEAPPLSMRELKFKGMLQTLEDLRQS